MHSRKASLLFGSSSCCLHLNQHLSCNANVRSNSAATPSSRPSPHRPGSQTWRPPRRMFASAAAAESSGAPNGSSASAGSAADASLIWPSAGHPSRLPTPYQILDVAPNAPYTKRRFYALVKLYHPDRTSATCETSDDGMATLPHGERLSRQDLLERYRLVIKAHDVLSNHDRRAAYDRTGYGWPVFRENHGPGSATASTEADGFWDTIQKWRTGGPQWPNVDDDPMYNATWEDWERWYERRRRREWEKYQAHQKAKRDSWHPGYFTAGSMDGQGQTPIFMSNYVFIALVALVTALAGIGQATRVHEGAKVRIEHARSVSEENSRVLMQVREEATSAYDEGEGKRERIRRFLKARDGYQGDFDGRVLRADDDALCAPKVVSERGEEPFWKKPPETR